MQVLYVYLEIAAASFKGERKNVPDTNGTVMFFCGQLDGDALIGA